MRFTIAIIAMAAAAAANVIPRPDYGGWNVTLSHTGGNDRGQTETVSGDFAHPELNDNIPVTCRSQGRPNDDKVPQKITCDPESFSYSLDSPGYDDGILYQLTLSQTVTLSGTNVTVKGISDPFKVIPDTVTGKAFEASNIIVQVSTAVA